MKNTSIFHVGVLSIVVLVVGWRSQIASSAIITDSGKLRNVDLSKLNASETWKVIEEVMDDYSELSDAYYAPAPSQAVREKRTLGILRNIWNRTRSGYAQVRTLFSGGSSSSGGTGGFRSFFSNLLNRILLFLTTAWDRITSIFNRNGSGGSGGGLFSRLFAGVTGIFSRFTGGGSGGGGGGLFGGLFGTTTTTESSFFYPESDYVYTTSSTTTTTTESYNLNNEVSSDNIDTDNTKDIIKLDEAVGKSEVSTDGGSDAVKKVEGGYSDDFIPFPGDAENNAAAEFRSSRSMPASVISAVFPIKPETKSIPHVVKSPGVLHLTDDNRFLVV